MLLHELAKLEENELGDKDAAASLYRRALELDVTDRDALVALDRLALEAGRDDELAAILRRRRELAKSPEERLEITLRLAEVLGDRLRDSAAAEEAFGEVLRERPSEARAVAGMERLAASGGQRMTLIAMALEPAYEASGEWRKLEDTLRRRLGQTTEKNEKRELRLRIAELAGTRNDDAAGAYQVLENAFLDEPADSSLWDRLAAAGEAAGKHTELATAFATAIENRRAGARGPRVPRQARGLHPRRHPRQARGRGALPQEGPRDRPQRRGLVPLLEGALHQRRALERAAGALPRPHPAERRRGEQARSLAPGLLPVRGAHRRSDPGDLGLRPGARARSEARRLASLPRSALRAHGQAPRARRAADRRSRHRSLGLGRDVRGGGGHPRAPRRSLRDPAGRAGARPRALPRDLGARRPE
jgi:hypothetical protein